jgi:hypothetical protein
MKHERFDLILTILSIMEKIYLPKSFEGIVCQKGNK